MENEPPQNQQLWPLYLVCIGITLAIVAVMFWPNNKSTEPTPDPILDQASNLDTLGWQSFAAQTFLISYPTYLTPLAISNRVEFSTENFSLAISEYKTQTQESLENYAADFMKQDIDLGKDIINPLLPTTFRGSPALTFIAKDKLTEVEKKYLFLSSPKGIYLKIDQTLYKNNTESQKIIDQMLNTLKIKG